MGWNEEYIPTYPSFSKTPQKKIHCVDDIDRFLCEYIKKNCDDTTCIFLSGGIDSAILASYLPEGARAYTIKFDADGAVDESKDAQRYADRYGLNLDVVNVTWHDYIENEPKLMRNKKSPLHPVEVGLYVTSCVAKKDGMDKILLGNGADSTFGGMDKLLSKDWNFEEFVERYSFVNASQILINPVSMLDEYNRYKKEKNGIDYISFLKNTHGTGIIQAFDNAIGLAECTTLEPYEEMTLESPLDLNRVRLGEPKYMLAELFKKRYPGLLPAKKIPFARPMDQWLLGWAGPQRREFRENCVSGLTGDQKYLIHSLERFLNLLG